MLMAGINSYEEGLTVFGAIISLVALVFLTVSLGFGTKRVPDDHIRILHRSGEPFRILEEGTHYVAEFKPFDDANFSCRPRINSRVPGQDAIADGVAKWAQIGPRGSAFEISVDTQWKLICTPEGILKAWEYTKRNLDTVKLESGIYQRHVVPIVDEAISACEPEISEDDGRESIKDYYSAGEGGRCVQNMLASHDSEMVEIQNVSGWQVRFDR